MLEQVLELLSLKQRPAEISAVIVADKNGENATKVAEKINGIPHEVDVADENQIRNMVATIEHKHGPIDLFCSNAGFVTSAGLEDANERIQKMWEVHVMAHIYAARAVLPQMIANGGGYLLNTASAAGLLTQIGSLSYSITKSAAVSLAEWISLPTIIKALEFLCYVLKQSEQTF